MFFNLVRKKMLSKFLVPIIIIFNLTISYDIVKPTEIKAASAGTCENLQIEFGEAAASVPLTHDRFMALTRALRATLAGKLATVFRSEWKAKLTVSESNTLIYEIAKSYLDVETFNKIMDGLDINKDTFVRNVHKRLFEIKDVASPIFTVRDPAPPKGASDTTFTYYTRAIKDLDGNGEGKHQIRVRSYMRIISTKSLEKMPIGHKVEAYDSDGKAYLLFKESADTFSTGAPGGLREVLTLAEMKQRYPDNIILYAPHGKNFKLEVKSSLLDQISGKLYPSLGGPHMVQKLDVSLSPQQVKELFGALDNLNENQKKAISNSRIDQLEETLKRVQPNQHPRIEAVLNVLRSGVADDPDYLHVEGATLYHRSAFESSLGFQLTVDRAQEVFMGSQMYVGDQLKSPMVLMSSGLALAASENAARHVELKFPVYAVKSLLGIELSDPESALLIPSTEVSPELGNSLGIYAQRAEPANPGKFHFLQNHGIAKFGHYDIDLIVGD
jgi:hypothetical protein